MFDQYFLLNLDRLWEATYKIFHLSIYVAVVYLVMDVLLLHELFKDNPGGDADSLGVGNFAIEVEIIHLHVHVLDDGSGYDAVTVELYGVKVCGGSCDAG